MFFKKKKEVNIIEKISKQTLKEKISRYINLILGCLILTVTFNVMFAPQNIVTGGVSGLSIITNNVFGISITVFTAITYVILLILSLILLGWKKTKGSILGSILYTVLLYATEKLPVLINFNVDNKILLSIVGGALYGIGLGLIFKSGFTSGGSDVIAQILSKYLKIPVGKAIMMFDGLVIGLSALLIKSSNGMIEWSNLMYSVITLYIMTFITDKVILGISESKSFHIITDCEEEVKKYIMEILNHGVTVLEAKGGYSGKKQKVIMCIVPTREYYKIKKDVLKIDPKACVLVTDAYEFTGGK